MKRPLAATTLIALLLTACQEQPTGPFEDAPRAGYEPPAAIGMLRSTVQPGEDALLWNTGCFDNDGYSRQWAFSDGTTATGANVTHRFADAGTYTVSLVVASGTESHSHTATVQVQVGAAPDSTEPQVRRP